METDISLKALTDLRNEILESMLTNIKNWDGTIESGIEAIDANQAEFDILVNLNMKLSTLPTAAIDDDIYNNKLNLLLKEQKVLTRALKDKREALLDTIMQLNKKDKVINNYISKNREALFVNKSL